jgi:hypothetical protein
MWSGEKSENIFEGEPAHEYCLCHLEKELLLWKIKQFIGDAIVNKQTLLPQLFIEWAWIRS